MEAPKKIKNFRLTPELSERLAKFAKLLDVSQTKFVKLALQEKMARLEKNMSVSIDA